MFCRCSALVRKKNEKTCENVKRRRNRKKFTKKKNTIEVCRKKYYHKNPENRVSRHVSLPVSENIYSKTTRFARVRFFFLKKTSLVKTEILPRVKRVYANKVRKRAPIITSSLYICIIIVNVRRYRGDGEKGKEQTLLFSKVCWL